MNRRIELEAFIQKLKVATLLQEDNDTLFSEVIRQAAEDLADEEMSVLFSVSRSTVACWREGQNTPHQFVKPRIYIKLGEIYAQILERISTCETCGTPLEFQSEDSYGWCREYCPGITDRIEERQQKHYRTETRDPCNLCGLSLRLAPAPEDETLGLVKVAVVGGYPSTPGNGSGALDDGTGYRFSLCEFCLDWLFGQFTIPVETFDVKVGFTLKEDETIDQAMDRTGGFVFLAAGPSPEPWRPAAERVRDDAWRKMRERFANEKLRRDLARHAGRK